MSIHESYTVREWFSVVQEVAHDGGPSPEAPLVKAAVGVIITNPFAGNGYQADLSSLTDPSAATRHRTRPSGTRTARRPPRGELRQGRCRGHRR